VTHTARLDVDQSAGVGLQRVAEIAERGAVGEDDLPVGARAREQLPVELGTGERAAGQRDDAPAATSRVAEIEWFPRA